jgi:hemolysin D
LEKGRIVEQGNHENLIKARDVNQRQILYAPVTGQVQELVVNTEGGVVTEAEVENISDGAIFDEKRGFTYSMLLAMKKKTIEVDGREVKLMPGMEVTAEIKTGKRRLIEYFMSPLMQHGKENLRER